MLTLLLFLVCCDSEATNHISLKNVSKTITQETLQNKQNKQGDVTSIKDTIGLIVLSKDYGKNDFIRFFNEDGTLWYEFTFYYDDKDGEFEYANENFSPFAFHPDYFSLALKCVGGDNNRYEVIVNEKTGLTKFIKKGDPTLKFETWEEHILKTFAIEFNREENSLRDKPNGKVKTADVPAETTFHAVEIDGEWLKLRWDSSNKAGKNGEFGWIRWKKNEHILIELFYIS